MLPLASAKRAARLTVDGKDVTKKVAFKCDLVTFGFSDEAPETDTLKTVVRCSDLQPGQKLNGHIVDLQTGERRGPNASEKRMYLMPWGDALIGIDPGTRRRLDYSVALAWEYDHWFMRSIRTSVDAEPLIGSIGRHPLSPPIDYGRINRFQNELGSKVAASPLKAFPFDALYAPDQCSRAHYVRIKRDTFSVMGHALKLHCAICPRTIIKDAMQCCERCKFHMPVCSKDLSPACFKTFWKNTHKAVCMRHRLVKSHAVHMD